MQYGCTGSVRVSWTPVKPILVPFLHELELNVILRAVFVCCSVRPVIVGVYGECTMPFNNGSVFH